MQAGIEVHDGAMEKIVDPKEKVLHVATGFEFTDGPVFGRTGYLLFTDPPSERIVKYSIPTWRIGAAEGSLSVFASQSGRARGLTLDHQGRLLVCESGSGRIIRRESDGGVTVLAEEYQGRRLSAPADLVYAIDGSIYFTDAPDSAAGDPDGRARVFQITRAGELRVATEECRLPTGVALDVRQLQLYVADHGQPCIRVFPIRADGALGPGQVFSEVDAGPIGGLKTDQEGNIYAAAPAGIWVFGRDGRHLGSIITPEQPSNCCWGRLFHGLYITARSSVYYAPCKIRGTPTF